MWGAIHAKASPAIGGRRIGGAEKRRVLGGDAFGGENDCSLRAKPKTWAVQIKMYNDALTTIGRQASVWRSQLDSDEYAADVR